MDMERKADIERKTKETEIEIGLSLEGKGTSSISTGDGFLDHMLDLFSRFSGIDVTLKARGDLHVDSHHLVEDAGICLGQALKKAMGDKKGIRRFGFASMPMDETLVNTSLDISGRPFLVFNVTFVKGREGSFDTEDAREFLRALATHSGITLHVNLVYGENLHHVNEAIFKSLGLALREALRIEGSALPSTKGVID